MILKNNHINTVLPGQAVSYKVPHLDSQLLAVQPCHQNKKELWPPPQLCKVNNGFISVQNTTPDIISLKHGNDKVQARTMDDLSLNVFHLSFLTQIQKDTNLFILTLRA